MLDDRLKDQNNGTSWLDCNMRTHPRPHRWIAEQAHGPRVYWRCSDCPVSTITTDKPERPASMPHPYLRNAPVAGGPARQPRRYA